MEEDTGSEMWKGYNYSSADGRTAFEYMDCDRTARQVVDWYVRHLACGLANLAAIFRPQIIMIGGGVAAAPAHLLMEPLREAVGRESFSRHGGRVTRILPAELGNDAGIIGAAFLGRAM